MFFIELRLFDVFEICTSERQLLVSIEVGYVVESLLIKGGILRERVIFVPLVQTFEDIVDELNFFNLFFSLELVFIYFVNSFVNKVDHVVDRGMILR